MRIAGPKSVFAQAAQDGLIDDGAEAADDAEAGTVGCGFAQVIAEEGVQLELVGAAAGTGALAGKDTEEADDEHLKVDGEIDARAYAPGGIGLGRVDKFD